MKNITFDGKEYSVPEWVSWVGRNRDGTIVGYQYQPFDLGGVYGYYAEYGQVCTIHSPICEKLLQRV